MPMPKKLPLNFYEVQRKQKRKSFFLLLILSLFYFFAIGLISLIFIVSSGLILSQGALLSGVFLRKLLLMDVALSIIIASFHYLDARKFGARFILKRLEAQPPDQSDRYHKRFINTADEIRIAGGLPEVNLHVIPSFAINSMAVISAGGTPNVIVTEGLLSEFTRDELQAVISHELAHILRGDTLYITLVCSLANFFEKIRQAIEPESHAQRHPSQAEAGGAPLLFLAIAVFFANMNMRLLSTLISRQREILADAAAVELSRDPKALARAIYKAHLKNSFVGDFNVTYSPLFIVPPASAGSDNEGFFANLFNTHPPLMKRIRLLASMLHIRPARIIQEVWNIQKNRERARTLVSSREESIHTGSSAAGTAEEKVKVEEEENVWALRDQQGKWQGPHSLDELLAARSFYPYVLVKNLQEGIEARAKEFPQIREAMLRTGKKKSPDPANQNTCPRCRIALADIYYEGVPLKICSQCGGKLVSSAFKERIITRKEVKFSEYLMNKARDFKNQFMENPALMKKIHLRSKEKILCPACGSRMLLRPFSLHYIIPVDKCLSCQKIWFDADELEILQILIEGR